MKIKNLSEIYLLFNTGNMVEKTMYCITFLISYSSDMDDSVIADKTFLNIFELH